MTDSQTIPDDIRDTAKHIAEQPWLTRAERDRMAEQIAKAIHDAVMAERERIILLISEQASALAEAAIYGLAENARSREAMEAALTKFSHIIRVAALPATPKAEGK